MSPDTEKVEKLKSIENWPKWSFQMKIILSSLELFGIVQDVDKLPVRIENELEGVFNTRVAERRKKDMQAQRMIITTVEDQPLTILMSCESSAQMWSKLVGIYDQKGDLSIHLVQQAFYKYEMRSNEDMATNIARIEEIANRLRRLGEEISESMVITKVLMSLPESYGSFVTAWESTTQADRTLNNLISRLLIEESRRIIVEKPVALISSKDKDKVGNDKPKSKLICFLCKKPGHIKRNCFHNKQNKSKNKYNQGTSNEREALIIGNMDSGFKDCDGWYLDSGASDHMTDKIECFAAYKLLTEPLSVRIGDGSLISAVGIGTINIVSRSESEVIKCQLVNALHVPSLKMNLFSLSAAMDRGLKLYSDNKTCLLKKNNRVIAVGKRTGRLFKLNIEVENKIEKCSLISTADLNTFKLWHERLGHQNFEYMSKINKNNNLKINIDKTFLCNACIYGKQHKLPFKTSSSVSTEVGQLVHMDVCGPMQVQTIGLGKYFLLFRDDFSNYRVIYIIARKDQVYEKCYNFIQKLKNETGKFVIKMRSDNGTEFVNSGMENMFKLFNIAHETTVEYTPEQNGKIERDNRTIIEMARTMLHSKNLNLKLWGEAVNTAVYIINRTYANKKNETPFQLWYDKIPDISNFKVFGSLAFSHIPKQKRQKLDKKSEMGIMVGYGELTKGYRIWNENKCVVEIKRDVIFDEKSSMLNSIGKLENIVCLDLNDKINSVENNFEENYGNNLIENNTLSGSEVDETGNDLEDESDCSVYEDSLSTVPENAVNPYFLRNRKIIDSNVMIADLMEPQTFDEAIKSEYSEKWKIAMRDEIKSLLENQTWTLNQLPEKKTALKNKWVYKIKRTPGGEIERFKARLVVKGYSQKEGIGYKEIFAPVVRYDSVRIILAIASMRKMHLWQFDVKTAFLYGRVEEDLYMEQPLGYSDGTNNVCKLHRSLYGLKQASRCWNERFVLFVKSLDFKVSKQDSCVFIKLQGKNLTILAIYVDDGLLVSTDEIELQQISDQIRKEFKIKMHKLNYYVGLEISTDNQGDIMICQKGYIQQMLKNFGMDCCKPVLTPIDTNKFDSTHVDNDKNVLKFREVVGCLNYLANISRPDIAYAVNYVSRFTESPLECHFQMLKRLLRYLRGTTELYLKYKCDSDFKLTCYSDADFAGDEMCRKSTTGFLMNLGLCTVSWCSQKQKIVALSTTEAEYVASCDAVKHLLWCKRLIKEFGYNIQPEILIDNQSSIKIIKNPKFHNRTKHIDVRYHYIREMYNEKQFAVNYVPSDKNKADFLTKPLNNIKFKIAKNDILSGFGEGVKDPKQNI